MHGSLRTLYRSQENLGFRLRQTALTDIIAVMAGQAAAMHVARIRSGYTDKQGRRREYESVYLRRTYRDGGTVKHETLANLSGLPEQAVGSSEAAPSRAAPLPARAAVYSPPAPVC